ncbi:ion channel [Methylocystis sp. IM2]|uniref:ion channel n=1 Tax=unclassified Methylocystis TaxID=2625913 RepID=UPI0040471AAD
MSDREAVTHGLRQSFWGDLHHHAVTARWPAFFIGAALVFVLCNLCFATLYMLGDDPVANARPGAFLDYFFFSMETFATVGYGDMHPRTPYGHAVAAIGAFIGVCALAVTTGLIFTRFTQPRARVLFARAPVVAMFDGARTLMIRFANERHNVIVDTSARLWLMRSEYSKEGVFYRRFHRRGEPASRLDGAGFRGKRREPHPHFRGTRRNRQPDAAGATRLSDRRRALWPRLRRYHGPQRDRTRLDRLFPVPRHPRSGPTFGINRGRSLLSRANRGTLARVPPAMGRAAARGWRLD